MDVLDLLKDKQSVIKFLLDNIQKSDKTTKGLRSLVEGDSSQEFKTQKLLEVVANQSVQIKHLLLLNLCYSQGTNFDVATMMNKMGRGNEALKQMFKNKMGGS